MIHDNLVKGGVSAFRFSWLMPVGRREQRADRDDALLPHAYVMGDFLRLVRPGLVRIDAAPGAAGVGEPDRLR